MNTRKTQIFALPTSKNPLQTLGVAKGLGGLVLLSLLSAGAWRVVQNQHKAEDLKQLTEASLAHTVISVHSRPGETSRKIVLPATLQGNTETQIYARSNGYISSWHKTIGDHVKKGELLAEIDVPELKHELAQGRANLAQIKARLELARTTYKRLSQLNETDGIIQQDFDEKRSAVLQGEADLAAAEANVQRLAKLESYRHVTAPFSGVITRRGVDVGNLISASSQELFALTQIDPLRVTVWVPQSYANDVSVGQEATVRIIGNHDKPLTTQIAHVAGALDPVNRSRQVDIILPNKDGKLLPGAYVEIAITIQTKASPLVVPANVLVVDQQGIHVVAVEQGNKIAFKPVKLGRDFGREVEVLEGISASDVLVASPSDLLVAGELVTVVKAPEKDKPKDKQVAAK